MKYRDEDRPNPQTERDKMSEFIKNQDGSVTYKNIRVYKDKSDFVATLKDGAWLPRFYTRTAAFRYIDLVLAQ